MVFDLHCACLRSCVGPWVPSRCMSFCSLGHPFFNLAFDVFPYVLCTRLDLLHPLILELIHYICDYPLDLVGTHLFPCSHGGEWITFHDAIWNAFIYITKDMRFHVSCKQTHVLIESSLSFYYKWVGIMLSTNDIDTLANMVIANPTWTNFISHIISFHEVVVRVVIQAKEGLYHNWHLKDFFFCLARKVFDCLRLHANGFFHRCVNMTLLAKGICGLPLVVLCAFYR
jgi:hypothetical protein